MKKLFYLLIIIGGLFSSCSSDDSSSAEPVLSINGTKLRRAIGNFGGNVVTTESIYDGNRLLRTTSTDGTSFNYTYTGDLITRLDFYRDNVLEDTTIFTYADDKLTGYISLRGNSGYRVAYTYNGDGTISITGFTGDSVSQNNQTDLNKKVFFQDGVVSSIEEYKIIDGNPETFTTTYTHDDANSPTSSILGHDKLTTYDQGLANYTHNVTSITQTATNSPEVYVSTIDYLYNTHNLPYKMTSANIVIDYLYE